MDMKMYYRRVRELESEIVEDDVVIISEATPDGGRAGVAVEAPRSVAAKMVADGKARLASRDESDEYRARVAEECRKAEQLRALSRPQFAVLSEAELRLLRSSMKSGKQ